MQASLAGARALVTGASGFIGSHLCRLDSETGKALYADMESLFGDPRSADGKLLSRLGSRLRELPRHRRIFAPLGVGGHVDHRLACRAAEQAGGERIWQMNEHRLG